MTLTSSTLNSMGSPRLEAAQKLPNGARFHRCALQINPFSYLERHDKPTQFASEAGYNAAIVQACHETDIEVVAITDHYRVDTSRTLIRACREAGLFAFGGFEAKAKDGVHFLCLFNPEKDDALERFIGDCGVHSPSEASPLGAIDSTTLMAKAREWGAAIIAAHVAANGGLLHELKGQARMAAWQSADLLACALPGPVEEAPTQFRAILNNKDRQHRRTHAVAIVNASDVNGPEDLKKDSASCFIKMSDFSVEALRQAFLDPDSRIRLHSDPPPEIHAEFLAMTWEGGFLDGTSVHFNSNLNALIGGRGAGKSTMIESMRYVLDLVPLGEEAKKTHEQVARHVLRPGTRVSLKIRSHYPSKTDYVIERTVPNPPTVKDQHGNLLEQSPQSTIPGVQVFGQHEISELAKSPKHLTLLLERFADRDPSLSDRKAELRINLEKSRRRIVDTQQEIDRLKNRLAALPELEEKQRRFQDMGLEEKLKEKSLLVKEETLFTTLHNRLESFRALRNNMVESLPIDGAFVSGKALDNLPNADVLRGVARVLEGLSSRLQSVANQFDYALSEADTEINKIKANWNERSENIQATYEQSLRELHQSSIKADEFIQLRHQIEKVRPLADRLESLEKNLGKYEAHRRALITEWENTKAQDFREIDDAATQISKMLHDRVQVKVTMAGNRKPLMELFKTAGGNLAASLERLRNRDELSLPDLARRCREGADALHSEYAFTPGAAKRIAEAGLDFHLGIEELELPATTHIKLNTAAEGKPAEWRKLEELSAGQKATAVLLLLLLESKAPLVVDQPEDDLDNRFITEVIVPIMRQEKRRRQFIFSTHNANIPVLGDAELILGLNASGEAGKGIARIERRQMGSIDSQPVRELVGETLEGGKHAFEMRRSKYGF